jgi:hypothetical protein
MLSLQDINNTLLKIVKNYPFDNNNRFGQPKTYSRIFSLSDLEKDNINMLYKNFQKGDFWARDWVAAGANEAELKREFPIVYMRVLRSYSTLMDMRDSKIYDIEIGVAEYDECIDDNCDRTLSDIQANMTTLLSNVIREFLEQQLYTDGTIDAYMSKIEAAKVSNVGYSLKKPNVFYAATSSNGTINYGDLSDKIMTASTILQITVCEKPIQFTYEYIETDKEPIMPKCVTCD